MPFCNLCGCREFADHKNRRQIRCTCCGSFDGHRLFGLLALHLLSARHGRAAPPCVTLLSEQAESGRLIQQVAPAFFTMRPAADLIAAGGFDILLLDKGVGSFALAPVDLLAAWRRGIREDGLIALPLTLGERGAETTPQNQAPVLHKAPAQLNGQAALEWLQKLPGWRLRIWDPHEHFEAETAGEMGLRYRPSVAPVLLLSPVAKGKAVPA
ncbi:hypothetical protein [Roseomonas sp. USHLN139]|uniref:hypothetical protein n=1 Tax=Roseomonas sp. USHLN139 TaxID=3081298 RepID=UPI003B0167E7